MKPNKQHFRLIPTSSLHKAPDIRRARLSPCKYLLVKTLKYFFFTNSVSFKIVDLTHVISRPAVLRWGAPTLSERKKQHDLCEMHVAVSRSRAVVCDVALSPVCVCGPPTSLLQLTTSGYLVPLFSRSIPSPTDVWPCRELWL